MAEWKRVLVSGSNIDVAQISSSNVPEVSGAENLLAITTDGAVKQISQANVSPTVKTVIGKQGQTHTSFTGDVSHSFEASGEGLAVAVAALGGAAGAKITYTIAPNTVFEDIDTSTVGTFTASYAQTASVIRVTEETNSTALLGIPFVNIATSNLGTDGQINTGLSIQADSGLGYVPNTNQLRIQAGVADYTAITNDTISTVGNTTYNLLNTTATTMNFAGAASTLNIGASTGTALIKNATINLGESSDDQVNIRGNAIVVGDLTVQGTTTSLQVTNLNVDDQFVLLNSGSNTGDGGIIVSTNLDGSGTALFYDDSTNRWALDATGLAWNATSGTPDQYIVSVESATGAPGSIPSDFGTNNVSRYGMMYVQTNANEGESGLWIFSE
jgi:hypothetical protein